LVGGFSLSFGGAEVRPVPLGARRLLALVALHDRPVSRRRAAFTLWSGVSEARAYGSLRTALFRLRASPSEGVLLEQGSELALSATVEVDVRRAHALAAPLLGGHSGTGAGGYRELEAILKGGELLPDWYEDWVLIERERYHEFRLRALEALCDVHLRSGAVAAALSCARAAVEADPVRESSRRTLISVLLADGNRAAALAQERQFREHLTSFGLEPSPRFEELVREITVG
jgi:DNA-binding SARP family transcriptional activator